MKSFIKFLLFVLVLSVALAGLYNLRRDAPAEGAVAAPASTKAAARDADSQRITQADAPAIDLSEVDILNAIDLQYTRLIKSVVPSVVSINTERTVRVPGYYYDPRRRFFGGSGLFMRPEERRQSSLGSGVIVSKEGHVISNHHVVDGMDAIEVVLHDGRTCPATLLDSDPTIDIAILKIDAHDLQPLAFGNSDEVEVGQLVFAIGNPYGFEESVSHGIISAVGRRSPMPDSATEFFQSTAALNPGNSGGPLVNLKGEIIGINNQIFSQSGGWDGIGLAIPSNTARRALESIADRGRIASGYLGVVIQPMDADLARQFGADDGKGALVAEVTGNSPAERAGLQRGDIIRQFNGKPVDDFIALRNRVVEAGIDKNVQIDILRDGKPLTLDAMVEEAPADPALAARSRSTPQSPRATPNEPAADAGPLRGVTTMPLTRAIRERLSLPQGIEGVVVKTLEPGTPAAQVLEVGDVIEEINRQPVPSVRDFEELTASLDPDNRTMVFICRERTRMFVIITP